MAGLGCREGSGARRGSPGVSRPQVRLLVSALALGLGLAGCAATQRVPVEARPRPVQVFVDGQPLAEIPEQGLSLRVDRSHVLHFKRRGYQSEQVVLESVPGPEGPTLAPPRVSVELQPQQTRSRQIDVELQTVEEGLDQ